MINFSRIRRLLDNNLNILIATSGGVDSMVLLDSVYRCCGFDKNIWCGYFEHNPDAPRGEEEFIKNTIAKKYVDVRFVSGSIDNSMIKSSATKEAGMRKLRYEWLMGKVNELPKGVLLTAHHKDDMIETALLGLFSKRKFAKMAEVTSEFKPYNAYPSFTTLKRPLLRYDKNELHEYAHHFKVDWMEDPTNYDNTYGDRNFVRNELLPKIKERFGSQDHLAEINLPDLL